MTFTIIVGTGRCGSTMLSRMLHMHPDVLSISEFWTLFWEQGQVFPDHDIDGKEFWLRISRASPIADGLICAGLEFEEYHYPYERGRFDPASGVPSICRVLAALTDDPDALYSELASRVVGWPTRPMAEHCRALFADLAAMLGRRVVVERTGSVLSMIPVLREQFPEARFVFLHRDGPDCALSMSRHPIFRIETMVMLAEAIRDGSSLELLPAEIVAAGADELSNLVTPPFDRERFLALQIPMPIFGWKWSFETRAGTSAVREVRRDRRTTLRYEHLLTSTRAELARLADFIGISAERQWLDRACDFVDLGRPGSAAAQLHGNDLTTLRAVCAAGSRAYELLESEYMT